MGPRWLDSFIRYVAGKGATGVIMAAASFYLLAYLAPNHLRSGEARTLRMTGVDRAVPFLPESIWVYLSAYLLVFPAFLLGRDRERGARFVAALVLTITLATLVHWVYPTTYPRERFPLPSTTGRWTRLAFESLRRIDRPTSCLPSLHVASAMLSALSLRSLGPWRFGGVLTWASLVAVSTLTTKQHYFVDVVGGAALSLTASLLVFPSRLARTRPSGVTRGSLDPATLSSIY